MNNELQAAIRVRITDFPKEALESYQLLMADRRFVGWLECKGIDLDDAAKIYQLAYIDGAAKMHEIRSDKPPHPRASSELDNMTQAAKEIVT